ncbi:MAG: sigma-54 dependent transcriptional regulator [Myxococcales bacterium]|nr:sigma-54 dependent transcriptional regulator [Myxococcales bacterium]
MPRILVVDDDRTIRRSLGQRLMETGYEVLLAEGTRAAQQLLKSEGFDAALVDIHLKDGDGLALLEEIRRDTPLLPVIMVTAYGDSERTIRAMKSGAFEYVTKPFELDALLAILARAVKVKPAAQLPHPATATGTLVGASPAMLTVWKAIGRAATSRVPVLITGESGTGKELVARAIHDHMQPLTPFVAVNLAALPPGLVESELFGHERGAFTGAVARREGRFELAGEGTLFLDEIADLEAGLQSKLLRVLEDGGYQRVGASNEEKNRARIISATSRLTEKNSSGPLREDLYYRLAVIRIDVPPLRERRQDVPLLVQAFLKRLGSMRSVSEEAMQKLIAYHWPGNVRQLRHVLENACVMSTAEVLDSEALELEAPRGAVDPQGAEVAEGSMDLKENIDRLTRRLIEKALERSGGNRAQAARLLGIRRALLYERMLQLGMRASE